MSLQDEMKKDSEVKNVNEKNMEDLSKLIKEQITLEDEIDELEGFLSRAKEDLRVISQETIPELMFQMNCKTHELLDGSKIEVKPFYSAKIEPENKEAAFKWLHDTNNEDIIKNEVIASFTKGEDEKAVKATELLIKEGYDVMKKESVHHSTLKAFVKKEIENGVNIPYSTFGIFVGNKTKIRRA